MRVIAVANQKGGCGKTTTSINFAACLASLQKRILLIDLDPQGHSTCGLGVKPQDLSKTLYDLLSPREEELPNLSEVLVEAEPFLYLLPAHHRLAAVEEELANLLGREKRLFCLLQEIGKIKLDFEYAVLDCPPHLGILTSNALEAADEVIIPIEPSFFSLHGLARMSETLKTVNQRRTHPVEIHALLTLFDSRTCFGKEVYEEVKTYFKDQLFRTIIHDSVLLKEASSAGKSIVEYAPDSGAFKDYFHLAVEYLERQWERLLPEKQLGWNYVLKSRFGPKRVAGGVLFQVVSKTARWVEIAGDFNHWVSEPLLRRTEDGLWQKVIPMSLGTYRYKFIVDGEWQLDPYQPDQRVNAFGNLDSCLEVA